MTTLGILGSGKGSNFAALLRSLPPSARVGIVLSDNPEAGILSLAREAGIPCGTIEEPRYRTRLSEDVEQGVADRLVEAGVGLVVLAGYMRLVKQPLLRAFPRRIINIHPSLLPAFPGLEAWKQALDAGVAETGCTVHFVDEGMDTGEIIAQSRVPVLPTDSAASLHARIQEAEHRLLPAVVADLCGRLDSRNEFPGWQTTFFR
ncbi:MAG: phosphoribosylglycinamide formyltransferase [Terrimicrobiaceae bacterium]